MTATRPRTENPLNWHRHPQEQLASIRDLIQDPEVGWAGACLFNERTGRLIDGHARKQMVDPRTPVPVLVGNWSEEAGAKVLATLDPLAAMELQPFEHHDYVMLLFRHDQDFQRGCELLGIEKVEIVYPVGLRKVGLGRCVDGAKAIDRLMAHGRSGGVA